MIRLQIKHGHCCVGDETEVPINCIKLQPLFKFKLRHDIAILDLELVEDLPFFMWRSGGPF